MGRCVFPPTRHDTGIGALSSLDYWANWLYYANTVGAFEAVSAGPNWGRLAIDVHWRALKLVDAKAVFILLFSDDALFLAEDEIFGESFLVIFP